MTAQTQLNSPIASSALVPGTLYVICNASSHRTMLFQSYNMTSFLFIPNGEIILYLGYNTEFCDHVILYKNQVGQVFSQLLLFEEVKKP